MKSVSIIICTRDRADALARTLAALDHVRVPSGWEVELIVIDNGSSDSTADVLRSARMRRMQLLAIAEPARGQCHARNTGLLAASGDVIVFTDDDVIPAHAWLEQLATPLLTGAYDAAVGPISLAPHLERAWMQPLHRVWLAARTAPDDDGIELVGANMAFRRQVLELVPRFDVELGPGQLGFGDDTLFSWQLGAAGCRLTFAPEAHVVHEPATSRLQRRNWLRAAHDRGRTNAYLLHHWIHGRIRLPALRAACLEAKLQVRRRLARAKAPDTEGCPLWEISYVSMIAKCRQLIRERRRPRNYARYGLRKLFPPVKPELITSEMIS